MYMKFKKGDIVVMIAGKDKGKQGSILRLLPTEDRIVVEGINIRTKHVRAKREGSHGERVQNPAPFSVSKAMLLCPHTKKPTRIGLRRENGERLRVSKQSGKVID